RGMVETNNMAPRRRPTLANSRAWRATGTKDFDDKTGDPNQESKGGVFIPVPGPPMGPQPLLSFRYWLKGDDRLRVQIFSLSSNYHHQILLTNLPQTRWQPATVDMRKARRPDGSGGPLSEDER